LILFSLRKSENSQEVVHADPLSDTTLSGFPKILNKGERCFKTFSVAVDFGKNQMKRVKASITIKICFDPLLDSFKDPK